MSATPKAHKRWTAASINFLMQDEMRHLLDVIPSKHDYTPHMAKASFTSVGSLADSPAPLLRPSPATGYAAEILDVNDSDLGYDADPCP